MLFCRSWFLLTESSSSEEKEGSVSRFLFSSSSRGLQGLGQLLRARSAPSPCPPPLNVSGGCWGEVGGREGGGGDKGWIPPFREEQGFRGSWSYPSCPASRSDCFLPVFKKSKKDAMKPGLKSKALSSACKRVESLHWCVLHVVIPLYTAKIFFNSTAYLTIADQNVTISQLISKLLPIYISSRHKVCVNKVVMMNNSNTPPSFRSGLVLTLLLRKTSGFH